MAQSTPGSTDLAAMLRTLSTQLDPETYVFCTFPPTQDRPQSLPAKGVFEESEGTTVITTEAAAKQHNLQYFFPSRQLTLTVHSSLDAVGLLAAITSHLAKEVGVGVNPVSGFYHDHLFVPLGKEQACVESLKKLAAQSA